MSMKTRYTTVDGEILAEKRGAERRQYIIDAGGSTVALLNMDQVQTDTFDYWPYGSEISRMGSTPTPFRFRGGNQWYSAIHSYTRMSYLDSYLGRFQTASTSRSGSTHYQYGVSQLSPTQGRAAAAPQPPGRAEIEKCLKKCKDQSGSELAKCMGKCLGDAFIDKNWLLVYCVIFPDMCKLFNGVDPCTEKELYEESCENCCHINYMRCLSKAKNSAAVEKCYKCYNKCAVDCPPGIK